MNSTHLFSRRTLVAAALLIVVSIGGCGGGGGGSSPNPIPNPNPNPGTAEVTVSGKITFDRPPFKGGANGLDMNNAVSSPARGVVVEAIDASTNAVLASTNTDASGNYSVTVAANRSIFVRAKAQLVSTSAPTFNYRVLNNTNSNALYALDGSSFNTGTANVTRNLNAPTGWSGTAYTSDRAAAPFAIIDTVYNAKQLILSANPTGNLPALDLYWSTKNKANVAKLCVDSGDIGTSFYQLDTDTDDCSQPLLPGIYVLGDYANGGGDTDEFDDHVIAHEFGHYVEDQFSRSDSFGGDHSPTDRLDLRVAFSEGWGDAFSGMAMNDPIYRDSQNGVSTNFNINVENDSSVDGWYSEGSVAEVLWDLFDPANEPGDTVALGFTPIYNAIASEKNTNALTSIFPFISALRTQNPAQSSAIGTLLTNESINGTDEFGSGETHDGGDSSVLPIYRSIALGDAVNVCSTLFNGNESANKLGNDKFFKFTISSTALVTITATGAAAPTGGTSIAATDPDIYVYKQGSFEAVGNGTGSSESIAQHSFAPGTYIIDVFDADLGSATDTTRRCMNVSLQGN